MSFNPQDAVNVRFTLDTTKKPDHQGQFPLVAWIYKRGTKRQINTGQRSSPGQWNQDEQTCSDPVITGKLHTLQENVFESVKELYYSKRPIDPVSIKNHLKPPRGKQDTPPTLKQIWFDRIRRHSTGKHGFSDGTIRLDVSKWNRVSQFLMYKWGKPDVPLSKLTRSFPHDFQDWLTGHVDPDIRKDKLHPNTAGSIQKRLRAVLREAGDRGINVDNVYGTFKIREVDTTPVYLTENELTRLKEFETDVENIRVAQSYFVFSAFSGLRIGDARRLTPANVTEEEVEGNMRPFLSFTIQKNRQPHTIPILPEALAVIKMWEGHPANNGHLLPDVSEQHVNRWLKVLADLAGLDKRITHNVSRHTFATTVMGERDVDRYVVQQWMGHRSVSSTSVYTTVTAKRLLQKFQ